jgi:hypothetical protein
MKKMLAFVMSSTAAAAQTPVGFAEPTGWAIPSTSSIEALATGDFDSDGDLDVVVASVAASALWSFAGDGAGQFALGAMLSNSSGGPAGPTSLIAADMDGDGVLDLVTSTSAGTVVIHRGLGGFAFASPVSIPVGEQLFHVVAADFDLDGRLDLAVCALIANKVAVLRSTGPLQYASPLWIDVGAFPRALAVARLDGDALPDLVVANQEGQSLSIVLNAGNGQFAPPQTLALGEFPTDVALADFNGDGALDVVTANGRAPSRSASILLGNGAGNFGAPLTLAAGAQAWSVDVADVNGDTHADLVLSLVSAAAVGIHLGRGDGTFADPTNFTRGGVSPKEALARDVDGDGLPDLVVADSLPSFSTLRALPGVRASGYCAAGHFTVYPCVPLTSVTGAPSVSAPDGFRISVTGLPPGTSGLVLYSVSGRQMTPWTASPATASWLCLRQPVQRTPLGTTLSTGGCDRRFVLDFNRYRRLHPSSLGQPFQVGQLVQAQAWLRDTSASGTLLSAAVEFALEP